MVGCRVDWLADTETDTAIDTDIDTATAIQILYRYTCLGCLWHSSVCDSVCVCLWVWATLTRPLCIQASCVCCLICCTRQAKVAAAFLVICSVHPTWKCPQSSSRLTFSICVKWHELGFFICSTLTWSKWNFILVPKLPLMHILLYFIFCLMIVLVNLHFHLKI